ncbi:MAG: asparagine synthase-related protein [Chloroflexota bacterium]
MSGIAAILQPNGQHVEPTHINGLIQALAWRGFDQQKVWKSENIAMGAVQLWTTPEDWGIPQPLVTPQGDCIIIDGRFDNRSELIQALKIPQFDSETMTNADLLWIAYKKWGNTCLDHFAGAFAFVIWDASERILLAGRDPLGLRSFFYFWNGRNFYSASTLHALRSLPILEPTLNKEYIWDYLSTTFIGSFDPEATPFKQIKRLPAGHFLQITDSGLEVKRYWKPWNLTPLNYKTDAEYREHFSALFDEIITAQSRAIGPIGTAFSGGLDSSAVVCALKELERKGVIPAQELHTFTMLMNQAVRQHAGPIVHQPNLDAMSEKYDVTVHKVESDQWIPMLEELPYRGRVPQDEPFAILVRPYRNMGFTIKQICPDIRVLLTGLGADEGLDSNMFFVVDWLRKGRVREALDIAKRVSSFMPIGPYQLLYTLSLAGLGSRSLAHRLNKKYSDYFWDATLGFRYHIRIPQWLPNQTSLAQRALNRTHLIPKNFRSIATQASFERNILLMGDNVRLYDDQYIGTAAGLEMRHPFYDRRLIEFFLRLPPNQKIDQYGSNKHVLRQTLGKIVPKPATKTTDEHGEGFFYVYKESLRRDWAKYESLFKESRAAEAGFIDSKQFLHSLEESSGRNATSFSTAITSTLALEFWLRELEEAVPPAPQSKLAAELEVLTNSPH